MRGVDCPWWSNPLKDESCTTGPVVPPDLWIIYNTRKACCNTNFLYSNICDNTPPAEAAPTKYPTISAPLADDFEVIPIKFDLLRVPDDIRIRDLKDEMTIVLKRILIKLAERLPELKITQVEEKAVLEDRKDRNLGKAMMNMIRGGGGGEGGGEGRGKKGREKNNNGRGLLQDVTLYFNVFVVRVDGTRFGPMIIQELRDSYDDVIVQIQSFTDTNYFGEDINLNLCTSKNGQFSTCLNDSTPRPTPPPLALTLPSRPPPPPIRPAMPAPTPVTVNFKREEEEPASGFPVWMIGLITAGGLVLLCTILCCLFFLCRPSRKDEKEIENNIYVSKDSKGTTHLEQEQPELEQYPPPRRKTMEDLQRRDNQRELRKKKKERRDRKKTRRLSSDFNLRLSSDFNLTPLELEQDYENEPQVPAIEFYQPQSTTSPPQSVGDSSVSVDKSFHVSLGGNLRTMGRDASYVEPGQENKPDPDSVSFRLARIANGGNDNDDRYYADDPSAVTSTDRKSKRDPTMYVNGTSVDPSMHGMQSMLAIMDGDTASRASSRRDPSVTSKRGGGGGGGGSRRSNYPPVGSEGWFHNGDYAAPSASVGGGGGGSHYGYENNADDPWISSPEQSFTTQPASLASTKKKSKRSKSRRGKNNSPRSFT